MQTQTISTKELRENFGRVLVALTLGTTLTLTYRDKKLAKIKPIKEQKKKLLKEEAITKVRKLAGGYRLDSHTPEELNKIFRESYEEMLS
ncbi:hypothetical protein A2686_02635 [Candidatus Woesebacteria bacterium RIFCSPHIGHO2_01_FULL_38_10]|uniref:Antitoxin n=1 Tax=Candidatus Woesebacteria bacterium RIFCSPLOWO2_01_FULL_39_10b TaxID=1802517 RepID=A0A1F8B8T6_9BACT|nr:MAG: hypothetical protein A2686_02635 [Candidatus Woesebacteria bacterium RIFCSPHIGHO2_01_FULL_38_10]OGM60464.1 MAG: hypothetical protein A2892_00325 [Candidatus Woesebacteria bacterium RIFCSPLOWO2_01_FULL_39_10b]